MIPGGRSGRVTEQTYIVSVPGADSGPFLLGRSGADWSGRGVDPAAPIPGADSGAFLLARPVRSGLVRLGSGPCGADSGAEISRRAVQKNADGRAASVTAPRRCCVKRKPAGDMALCSGS